MSGGGLGEGAGCDWVGVVLCRWGLITKDVFLSILLTYIVDKMVLWIRSEFGRGRVSV